MASSAFELLAAYVSISVRGAEVVTSAIDRVDAGMKRLTSGRALVTIQSNALQVANDITSVETTFVRTNDAVRRVNDQLAITQQRVLAIAQAGRALATRNSGGGGGLGGLVPISPSGGSPSVIPAELVNPTNYAEASSQLGKIAAGAALATAAYQALAVARQAAFASFQGAISEEQDVAVFRSLIGNAEQATAILEQLHDFASDSVFSFPELRQAAIRMAAVGIPADKLVESLRAVAIVSAATGADINNVIRQYGQAMGQTTLRAEELQIMVENGVPIYRLLAESMQITEAQVRELGRAGKLLAEELPKAFILAAKDGGTLANVAREMNEVTGGALKSIKQNALEIGTAFASWTLGGITQEIDGVREALELIAFLANKLKSDNPGQKAANAAGANAAVRGIVSPLGGSFYLDMLKAISVLSRTREKVDDVADAADSSARKRIDLAEGVTEAEMKGVEKVVEAQNRALAESERKFAAYWQRLRRGWQRENEQAFDGMVDAIRQDNSAAEALRRSLMTPMDEFKQRITEAQELLNKGLISDGEFNAAFKDASKDLTDIQKQIRAISNVRTSFIVGQSGELTFRMQSSRTQDLHLIEAKQQSRLDSERNKILSDIRTDLQKRADNAKPEVTADTFPTELF